MKTAKNLVVMAALLTAAPALAQTTPMPTPIAPVFTVQPIPPTDPARLAAARPVIDRIWPVGSCARMMHTVMGPVMQDSMARAFAMKPGDIVPGFDMKDDKSKPDETLGQMAAKDDPYFQQRVTLTMNAVGDELAKLGSDMEPGVRDALAHAYARRFTVAQLGELHRFFATPTGQAYAADSLTLMMSPDMTQAMQNFLPNMIKAAPEMMARVAAATKDLPPAGKKNSARAPVVPPVKTP